MSRGLSGVSSRAEGVAPRRAVYKSSTEDILRAMLCTRRYTVVYTRVYLTLLGSRYTIGVSAPRMQTFYLVCILLDYLALALW